MHGAVTALFGIAFGQEIAHYKLTHKMGRVPDSRPALRQFYAFDFCCLVWSFDRCSD